MHNGDQLLGFAAALIGQGTPSVVASAHRVPDTDAAQIMTAYHAELAVGATPAGTLAAAQADVRVAPFVCFGAG